MEAQGLLAQASQDKLRRDQVLTQKARFEQASGSLPFGRSTGLTW